MINTLINILHQKSIKKRVAKNIVLIAYSILKSQTLFMRQLALYIPSDGIKQSRVNRIWRFFHKMKFNTLDCFKAFAKLIVSKVKTRYVIVDFTSLKAYDVSIFIASFPLKGRSCPFYARVLRKSDIESIKYKSQNDFIFKCMEEILGILPFKPIIIADRGFCFYEFLRFVCQKGVGFVIRLRKDKLIRLKDGREVKVGGLKKGKYLGYLREELFIKLAITEGKDEPLCLGYTPSFISTNTLHMARIYLKRMQCEQTHRELKMRLKLLGLNKKYYKESYNLELLERYMVVFMFL